MFLLTFQTGCINQIAIKQKYPVEKVGNTNIFTYNIEGNTHPLTNITIILAIRLLK